MDEYFECKVENDDFCFIYDRIMAEYDDTKPIDENFSHICSTLSDYEYSEYLQSCKALALIKAYRDFTGKVEITNEQIERIKKLDHDGLVELDADDIFLSKRKAYLDKFFVKMLKPCATPKAKRKRKLDFKKGDCIYNVYEGKYIIGVVLEENQYDGFEVRINENRECSVSKENPWWEWKHITAPDYKYLKDYIK